jgi:hypothetical protein
MNDQCRVKGVESTARENAPRSLGPSLAVAARSHVYEARKPAAGATAIYTLADPRDVRCPRYVGQTRDPRRRFVQHVRTARLSVPDLTPWWVRSPKHRPLYEWIRALYRDEGRLPFMWVTEWIGPRADARVAERAAIMRLLAEGAALLNVEARSCGAQLPLL